MAIVKFSNALTGHWLWSLQAAGTLLCSGYNSVRPELSLLMNSLSPSLQPQLTKGHERETLSVQAV